MQDRGGKGKIKDHREQTGRPAGEVRKAGEKGEGGGTQRLRRAWGRASFALPRGGRLKAESQQAVEVRNKS